MPQLSSPVDCRCCCCVFGRPSLGSASALHGLHVSVPVHEAAPVLLVLLCLRLPPAHALLTPGGHARYFDEFPDVPDKGKRVRKRTSAAPVLQSPDSLAWIGYNWKDFPSAMRQANKTGKTPLSSPAPPAQCMPPPPIPPPM